MTFSYLEFENRFRGSAADVKKEQEKYVPYFSDRQRVLDIGSGRGEFLELLRESGVRDAYGVDIYDEMVELSRARGLRVLKEDALRHVEGLEDSSLEGVFISHVVEHLAPPDLLKLIALIHRKLVPGSFLLAETLNPQCLFAIGPYFMDFTHLFPVHPLTFRFVLESQGFSGIDFIYRQYLPPEFLKLSHIPPEARQGTPFEEAYTESMNKLQLIIDQVFMNFIYCIVAKK
jgi:O-antigen chain-terminating methyltransferase